MKTFKPLLFTIMFCAYISTVSASPVNLALTGDANQSSTLTAIPSGGGDSITAYADLAIDGITDGNFWHGSVSHTKFDSDAWWEVDLGDTYTIDHINIWNRTDGGWGYRLHHFTVSILNDVGMSVWQNYYEDDPGYLLELNGLFINGQFVKIEFDSGYTVDRYLQLAEVQVWGDPNPVPLPGAVWLFVSSIIGIVSVSRKLKK